MFLDGFFGYHQTQIAPKDHYKMTFIMDWGVLGGNAIWIQKCVTYIPKSGE